MLMTPNNDETAVHGCHCLGDKAVRMLKVLAILRSRSWYVCASVGNCGTDFQLVCFEQTPTVTIFGEHGITAHIL